jgi:hypothetical protein
MAKHADRQRGFANALLEAQGTPPDGIHGAAGPTGEDNAEVARRRFAIHRNNVQSALVNVLAAHFPAVVRVVGEPFFRGLASDFCRREPPSSPVLSEYGRGFPAFIASCRVVGDIPYLADLARLEWLCIEAANAEDAETIGPAELAAVPNDSIPGLRLRLHPALRLFQARLPALTIWELNARTGPIEHTVLEAKPEFAIVHRPRLTVEVHRVEAPVVALAEGFLKDLPLSKAIARAMATSQDDEFELQAVLAHLITMGAIVAYSVADSATNERERGNGGLGSACEGDV